MWCDECVSGVHRRISIPPPAPTVVEIARELHAIVPDCLSVVVLECSCGLDARAVVTRADGRIIDVPAGVPMQLLDWAGRASKSNLLAVPSRLRSWLPIGSAAVVPIATPAWSAGGVVLPSGPLLMSRWASLRAFAAEVALRLERADRRMLCASAPPPRLGPVAMSR